MSSCRTTRCVRSVSPSSRSGYRRWKRRNAPRRHVRLFTPKSRGPGTLLVDGDSERWVDFGPMSETAVVCFVEDPRPGDSDVLSVLRDLRIGVRVLVGTVLEQDLAVLRQHFDMDPWGRVRALIRPAGPELVGSREVLRLALVE